MNSKIGPTPPNAPDVGTHLKDKPLYDESRRKRRRQQGQKLQNLANSLAAPHRRGGQRGNVGGEKNRSLYASLRSLGLSALIANRYLLYETYRSLKAIVSLSLLLNCLDIPSIAQAVGAQSAPQAALAQPGEGYAGIALTTEWDRAVPLRVS